MLIEVKTQILLITGILLLIGTFHTNASKRSQDKADKLIEFMCESLSGDDNDDLTTDEIKEWAKLCEKMITPMDERELGGDINDENVLDESSLQLQNQRRKSSSRSGSRSGSSSRFSFRGSRSSGSRTGGGGGSSSGSSSRYRSTRTGTRIIRPTGWLWSRSRHTFLPVSRRYYYRSRSSNNRFTTPPTGPQTFYYCASNTSIPSEIQCSTINGDTLCCEDENTRQVYCCGGKIDDDLKEDFNQATVTITQIFLTFSAITFFMHIFMKRLHG